MPEPFEIPRAYRFGVFEVDLRSGELRRHGIRVRLRGKPVDILSMLLERRGETVSRDELRDRLWPVDTPIDFDHGLNAAVNKLREALGDSADRPTFIETLPRRGYRFIAPIEPVPALRVTRTSASALPTSQATPTVSRAPSPSAEDTSRGSSGSRRWIWVGATVLGLALVAVTATYRSRPRSPVVSPRGSTIMLAVLPFDNLSGSIDQEFFSDGFTEEMIAQLGAFNPSRIGVIGRTSVMQYKGARKTIGEIGRELDADYILEGSVRRSGQRVRITAQLIQVSDQTHVWAESYERELADVLTIQEEVAGKIAQMLAGEVLDDSPRGQTESPAISFAAYENYLRGRFFREQATEASVRRAIEHYEKAIALDPAYAQAHAGLGDAYGLLGAPGWEVGPPAELFEKAKLSAEKALRLDPQLAEAHTAIAMVHLTRDWDTRAAEQELKHAFQFNPSLAQAHQYYSSVLTVMGRHAAAIDEARKSVELDPLSPTANTTLGVSYYYAGRHEEAIRQFNRTLELTPDFAVAHWGLAMSYLQTGKVDLVIGELNTAFAQSGNSSYMLAWLGYGLARTGQPKAAAQVFQDLEARARTQYMSPFHFALVTVGLGRTDEALSWLEKTYDAGSGWVVFLPVEAEFSELRHLPRFERLLASTNGRALVSDAAAVPLPH